MKFVYECVALTDENVARQSVWMLGTSGCDKVAIEEMFVGK